MTDQIELFKKRLPIKPYCTDSLNNGLSIRKAEEAIKKKYIQFNPPNIINWIVLDIDRSGFIEEFQSSYFPPPNIIVTNKNNMHCHAFYSLEKPVTTTSLSRIKPIKYLQAIKSVLEERTQSDPGYAGLVSKNPLSDYWQTRIFEKNSYTLEDFLDWFDLPKEQKIYKKSSTDGLGRNCTIFEEVRRIAYKNILAYRLSGKKEADFYNYIFDVCQSRNSQFPVPLVANELKAIAKSISKWTWKRYFKKWEDTEFSKIQSTRGKRSGEVRAQALIPKIEDALSLRNAGKTQAEIAELLGVSTRTIIRWLNK